MTDDDVQIYYPVLPEKSLFMMDLILRNAVSNPDYLSGAPYTLQEIETISKLVTLLSETEEAQEIEAAENENKWVRLERESNKLFKMLTEFSSKLDNRDNTETMAYFRTATSLLDKIVSIQERSANLKQLNTFHTTVLNVMEDVLDATQRTEVLAQLRKSIHPED